MENSMYIFPPTIIIIIIIIIGSVGDFGEASNSKVALKA